MSAAMQAFHQWAPGWVQHGMAVGGIGCCKPRLGCLIGRSHPLLPQWHNSCREAQDLVASQRVRGKVVLRVAK